MVQISLLEIIGLNAVLYNFDLSIMGIKTGIELWDVKDTLVHIVSSNLGRTAEWDPIPKNKIKMMGVKYMLKISGNKWELKVVMPYKRFSV